MVLLVVHKHNRLLVSRVIGLIFVLMLTSFNLYADNSLLKYPGNGIPLFSKSVPIKPLNQEMKKYFGEKTEFSVGKNTIKFGNLPQDTIFHSTFQIAEHSFYLELIIQITSGKAVVAIGEVTYVIVSASDESSIAQYGKTIYSEKNRNIDGISLVAGDKNIEVAYLGGEGRANGKEVKISFPATITITLLKGSSGYIGSWQWSRGFK